MYSYREAEKHLSNPSISCPLLRQQSVDQNSFSENVQSKRSPLGYVDSRYSEISVFCDENKNRNQHIVRNIFTKLRSTSSEELAALLNMSSESSKMIPDWSNFYSYYSQVLAQKESQNSTTPSAKQRNVACLCKPVNGIERVMREQNVESHTSDNTKSTETEEEKKPGVKTDDEGGSPKQIRVCLPLDPGGIRTNLTKKGLKIVICGDRKPCNCKRGNVEVAAAESSSFECLACTISKNPQFKNLVTGVAKGEKKKSKNNRFSKRLSTVMSPSFPFFKKKHRNTQVPQCSDKCEQTCAKGNTEAMVNTDTMLDTADRSCTCCFESAMEKNNRASHCTCFKCGKVDLQKIFAVSRSCGCDRDDTLKMLLKMESKQNYRQIRHILKEIKDQRQEIRDLHRRYTSLLKLQICKSSGGDTSDKLKEFFSAARGEQMDHGRAPPADHQQVDDIKQLKDAINQSTVDQQNKPEKTNSDVSEQKNITNTSELSLFVNNVFETPDFKESTSDMKELTDNEDLCPCLANKNSNKCAKFWKNLFGKKAKVCLKQCECKGKKQGKCRNLFEEKVKVRPEKGIVV